MPDDAKGPKLDAGVPESSILEGVAFAGHVRGKPVILVRCGKEILGIGATCTHYGGPLADGLVVGDTVRCPWHHARFSLRTGEAIGAPALAPQVCYEVARLDGRVVVTREKKREPARVWRRARVGKGQPRSVAIVGAGAAGTCAAQELRRLGYAGEVTLIDRDLHAPYDRPNLSKDFLAGTLTAKSLPLLPRAFFTAQRVELLLGRAITRLDALRRRITFDDGVRRQFGAIVLALGADPVRIEIPGEKGPPVHYLRSLADSRSIIRAAKGGRRAVVLGASFIGLEVAAALRARKIEVHVVSLEQRPLQKVLGPEFGDFVRTLHEEKGVRDVLELAELVPSLRVSVAGHGPLEGAVAEAARRLSNLEFAGSLDRPGVLALLERARVALMPSRWQEPAGIAALEAMSVGTPVVAYASGGLAEYVGDVGGGRVIEPDAMVLARECEALHRDREAWEQLSERGLVGVASKHSPEDYARAVERIYRRVIAAAPASPSS